MREYCERFFAGYLYGCKNSNLLDNAKKLLRLVITAAKKSNAKIIGTHVKRYPGQGVNVVIDIGESVIILQSWPEKSYAFFLFHSSYSTVNPERGFKYISSALKSKKTKTQIFEGFELPPDDT